MVEHECADSAKTDDAILATAPGFEALEEEIVCFTPNGVADRDLRGKRDVAERVHPGDLYVWNSQSSLADRVGAGLRHEGPGNMIPDVHDTSHSSSVGITQISLSSGSSLVGAS